jgi:glycosyltransferase involved in cell wall biosynthesis
MARVDVVVPCFNYGHFLPQCLDSVLSQEGVQVRVLVIDDCSTDDSVEVAEALAAADTRIEVSRHSVNRGHIATYNEGLLGWAGGDYTVLLSADDLLAPGALARAAAIMDHDRRVGMVYGRAPYFADHDQLPQPRHRRGGTTRWSGAEWIEGRCRAGYNVISSPEVVVRNEVQLKVGGYRPELPHAGDLEMWLRIAAVSDIAYVRGIPQAYYRVHGGSMQRTQFQQRLDDLVQRREVYARFFADHGSWVPDAARLHRLAKRALARDALWQAYRAYDRDAVGEEPVEALVEFAHATYPDAATLGEHRALVRRQRLGARICHRTQVFAASGAWARLRANWSHHRWQRCGV